MFRDHLEGHLSEEVTDKIVKEMIAAADVDGNQKIRFAEFVKVAKNAVMKD